jgi:hypothetical protein
MGWPKTREEREAYIVSTRIRFGYTQDGASRRTFFEPNDDGKLSRRELLGADVWVFSHSEYNEAEKQFEKTIHVVDTRADLIVITDAENFFEERVHVRRMSPATWYAEQEENDGASD